MSDLIFSINAVLPIVLTVAVGYFIKRIGVISEDVAKSLNKLVFRVLLPVMLFNNIYKMKDISNVSFGYLIYVAAAVAVLFFISLLLSPLMTKERSRRAVLIQSAFRSNYALIGIPLAISLVGEGASGAASLLSAVSIPVFNIFAVVSLALFDPSGKRPSVKKVLLGIIKNPLIIGIFAGLLALGIRALFGALDISWRLYDITAIATPIDYLSRSATPLALIALGAQFNFKATAGAKREIIIGTLLRTLISPTVCIGIALLIGRFEAAHYAAFIGVFATPLAVSTVPMTQEMGSDSSLAGQLVITTTICSALSIFLFTYLLKLIGIF
ncbi:MAG: AEC family transporter [Clostridia bacterium]|nr:AEC family transporter [Clostridia bacterium]